MPSNTNPAHGPILEPWRILALVLIVAAGMLFVHLVVPADASADPVKAIPVPADTQQPHTLSDHAR